MKKRLMPRLLLFATNVSAASSIQLSSDEQWIEGVSSNMESD